MDRMTDESTDGSAQAAALDFAGRLVQLRKVALGPELLGAYLMGSLAHGGFSRRYSDVDIALVTETGLPPQTFDRIRIQAVSLSAHWGPKLSLFWIDRDFSLGRFPPLDRLAYLHHPAGLAEP